MIIVIPRFLIGAAAVYAALYFLGPTVLLTCIAAGVGIYLIGLLIQLLRWLGPASIRGGAAGVKRAMHANYRAITKATAYGLLGGLLSGLLISLVMGVIALPFVGLALLSKDLIVLAVFGWFISLFGLMCLLELNREAIQAKIPAWREKLLKVQLSRMLGAR